MKSGNLLTLWDQAWPPESIPSYPTYKYKIAEGGEDQHYIAEEIKISDARSRVVVGIRSAEPGERLRDADLRFLPDWTDNLHYRRLVQERAAVDENFRAVQWVLCKSSILYYANTFVYIQDPWAPPDRKHIPFVTFPFQDDVLTWMVWILKIQQDAVVEKSREMGLTWMSQVVDSWLSNFYNESTLYNSSLTEDEVDNRMPDSLMGKFRYIQKSLPEWMRGGWTEHGDGIDKQLKITIPETRSVVSGEKVKSTMGRGGRALKMNVDEFAFVDAGLEALEALSSLAKSVFYISTPNGAGNAFYHVAHDPAVLKKTLHWSQHPLKNPEWAKFERSKPKYYDDAIWDKEHEIRYETSVVGRVFPQLVSVNTGDHKWVHVRDDEIAQYDPAYDVLSVSDFGVSDPCCTLFCQVKPCLPEMHQYGTRWTLVFFDEFEERNMTATDLRFLLNSKPYKYRDHIGDMRSATQRDSGGRTWQKNLADRDAKAQYSTVFRQVIHPGAPVLIKGKRSGVKVTIEIFRSLLAQPGSVAFNRQGVPHLIKAVQNWSFPLDPNTRQPREDVDPNHDQWSHACKAALYVSDWLFGDDNSQNTAPMGDFNFPARRVPVR